ncbi:hypothetical protein KUCAC02_035935 [Chaenocephalus aceratus]|nr:hypothetical protein KUCAC02_035935 [Chaenocephalus aceratus]
MSKPKRIRQRGAAAGAEGRGADRQKTRTSNRNKSRGVSPITFTSERSCCPSEEQLREGFAERDSSLLTVSSSSCLRGRPALGTGSDLEVKTSQIVQQHLLKTSKSIRQLYSTAADVDGKVIECKLQMAEEVADIPVVVERFLGDEVLPGFLTAVPRVLADVYHSLGTQLPEALVASLPADFFSDESVTKDSVSPSASSPPLSTHSLLSDDRDRLQSLRNRSPGKRRGGMLTRHRSMTESSQSLRQIEIPKKTTRASKSKGCVALEKPAAQPPPQKQDTQEVTKSGHKLMTKKVCETPHHKQGSNRLLYRQKMGRRSVPTEECIVEESPVKPADDLRRSPRIKKFARRHSNVFYSSSQPRSSNLERALSLPRSSLSAMERSVE